MRHGVAKPRRGERTLWFAAAPAGPIAHVRAVSACRWRGRSRGLRRTHRRLSHRGVPQRRQCRLLAPAGAPKPKVVHSRPPHGRERVASAGVCIKGLSIAKELRNECMHAQSFSSGLLASRGVSYLYEIRSILGSSARFGQPARHLGHLRASGALHAFAPAGPCYHAVRFALYCLVANA